MSKYVRPMMVQEKKLYDKINRILKKDNSFLRIRKSRSLGMLQNCGEFYILDIYSNTVCGYNVNLENYLEFLLEPETISK